MGRADEGEDSESRFKRVVTSSAMTSSRRRGWVWVAVGEDGGFWSGRGGLQARTGHLERMTSGQPGVWAVHGPGEALEIVERVRQRAWGQLDLHLHKCRKAPPGLWAPDLAAALQAGCRGVGSVGQFVVLMPPDVAGRLFIYYPRGRVGGALVRGMIL